MGAGCRGYCEEHKGGTCEGCWNESPGAPPCNLRGTACMADDGLGCQACWSPDPLPENWMAPAAPIEPWVPPQQLIPELDVPTTEVEDEQDFCRTDIPECESCCTGSKGSTVGQQLMVLQCPISVECLAD